MGKLLALSASPRNNASAEPPKLPSPANPFLRATEPLLATSASKHTGAALREFSASFRCPARLEKHLPAELNPSGTTKELCQMAPARPGTSYQLLS